MSGSWRKRRASGRCTYHPPNRPWRECGTVCEGDRCGHHRAGRVSLREIKPAPEMLAIWKLALAARGQQVEA